MLITTNSHVTYCYFMFARVFMILHINLSKETNDIPWPHFRPEHDKHFS